MTLASLFPHRLCDAHSFVLPLVKGHIHANSQVTTVSDKLEKAKEQKMEIFVAVTPKEHTENTNQNGL